MTKIDRNTIEMQVRRILAGQLDIDMKEIKGTALLTDDLGIDSFGSIEIAYGLEDEFGIEISEGDFANVKTVNDVIEYIFSRISSQKRDI